MKGNVIRIRTDRHGWRRVFVEHPTSKRIAVLIDANNQPIETAGLFVEAAAEQEYEAIAEQYLFDMVDGAARKPVFS